MSITITAARWANPDQTRVLVTTTERGAVLLKPERTDEWAALDAWRAAGGVVSAFVVPTEDPARAYQRRLRGAWVEGPPEATPDAAILALRLVAELMKELDTAGVAMTPRLRSLVARIRAAEAGP